MALAQDAETKESSVVAAVAEQWGKLSSMRADVSANAGVPAGENTLNVVATGDMAFLKKDDKAMARMELSVFMAESASDAEMAHVLLVSDGAKAAVQYKLFGRLQHMDLPAEQVSAGGVDGQLLVGLLNQHFTLKDLPDGELDGKPVYMLEGAPTFDLPNDTPLNVVRAYFDKETGVLLRLSAINTDGSVLLDVLLKNIELNPDISESLFVVPAPPPPPEPKPAPGAPPATESPKEEKAEAASGE